MNRRSILAFAGLAAATQFTTIGARGQSATTPVRLRGTLDAVAATRWLTLRNHTKATVKIMSDVRVTWLTEAQPGDIQPGSYVGTAAIPQADGSLKALEVQVFPPSMRGVGEGTRPWDMGAGSSMTNGTVGSLVASSGRVITITYKGGERRVLVPDDVPIVTYQPTDRSALTPGAHVLISAMRSEDGTITATSVNVGKNGLVPPM